MVLQRFPQKTARTIISQNAFHKHYVKQHQYQEGLLLFVDIMHHLIYFHISFTDLVISAAVWYEKTNNNERWRLVFILVFLLRLEKEPSKIKYEVYDWKWSKAKCRITVVKDRFSVDNQTKTCKTFVMWLTKLQLMAIKKDKILEKIVYYFYCDRNSF